MLEVRRPDVSWQRLWLDYVADFDGDQLHGSGIAPERVADTADPEAFAAWVAELHDQERGEHLAPGRVRCTNRWVLRDGAIVGVVNLRHELTPFLRREGGHIGFSVHPRARRQGVASAALAAMLDLAAAYGINPVLVTCEEDNRASAGVIEKAGGVLENVREGKRRYWITRPGTPLGYAASPLSTTALVGRLVTLRLADDAELDLAAAVGEGRAPAPPEWAPGFPRVDDLDGMRFAPRVGDPQRRWGSRLIVRESDDRVVGTLGFFGPPDPGGRVEIGYGLVEQARGHGLIGDALRLVVPAAEAAGARVGAHVAPGNTASRRALESAAFRATGEHNADGELCLERQPPQGRGPGEHPAGT